jgi:hypothetical protein
MTNVQQEVEDTPATTRDVQSDSPIPPGTDAGSVRINRSTALIRWLRDPVDRRLKIQVAAAILLTLLVGSLTFVNTQRQNVRDAAYQQVVKAVTQGDTYAILSGAEDYLSNPPLSGRDERRTQVIELYSEALVKWFIATHTMPPTDRQERVDRYRELVVNAR